MSSKSKFKCSICGREISFTEVAYIKRDVVVCTQCMPRYYVRNLCPLVSRRLRGEEHPSCKFCKYYDECTKYINSLRSVT